MVLGMQVAMAVPIRGKIHSLLGSTSLFDIGKYYGTNKLNLSN